MVFDGFFMIDIYKTYFIKDFVTNLKAPYRRAAPYCSLPYKKQFTKTVYNQVIIKVVMVFEGFYNILYDCLLQRYFTTIFYKGAIWFLHSKNLRARYARFLIKNN